MAGLYRALNVLINFGTLQKCRGRGRAADKDMVSCTRIVIGSTPNFLLKQSLIYHGKLGLYKLKLEMLPGAYDKAGNPALWFHFILFAYFILFCLIIFLVYIY